MALPYHRANSNVHDTFRGGRLEIVAPPTPAGEYDWTALRDPKTTDTLLQTARRWTQSLPATANASTLIQAYPRIANRIAYAWRDERLCLAILDELLVDRRGGRRGFDPAVQEDLLALRSLRAGGQSACPGPFYASPME